MSLSQWLLLLLLSVLWGGSFLFVGIAVGEIPPLTLVLARVGIAALLLVPVVLLSGARLPAYWPGWRPYVVMGILNNLIPFTLIVAGQREIASGLASVINATTPMFALLVARGFGGDGPLPANKVAGVLAGIAGVAILVGREALVGRPSAVGGMLLCLGAAVSYGFSGLWGRRFKGTPPLVSAAAQLVCSSLMLLPLALLVDQPWALPRPSPRVLWAVLGLAALATSLAYVVFFRIMAVSGPTNAMLVTLLIPVSAITMGVTVLGETLHARHVVGAMVIGLSLLVIDGRPVAWLLRRG